MKDPLRINAYGFCGYPAAGKTTVAERAADVLDAQMVETGDYVRAGARNHFGTNALSSNELGEYSTMRRRVDGGDYVAQDVLADMENRGENEGRDLVISGMRDTEEMEAFDEAFEEFATIWVYAPFDTRLHRLQKRNRQDEGNFTREDLAERDGRESMWGTSDLTAEADIMFRNTGREEEVHMKIQDTFAELAEVRFHEKYP